MDKVRSITTSSTVDLMNKTTVPSNIWKKTYGHVHFPSAYTKRLSLKRDSSSVEEDVFVFGVGNLLSALQSPDSFSHVFGLQRWCVSPLLTHVKSWSARKKNECKTNIIETIIEAYSV